MKGRVKEGKAEDSNFLAKCCGGKQGMAAARGQELALEHFKVVRLRNHKL